jgi:hypothetical protein
MDRITIPTGAQADLPEDLRREVLALARDGCPHPDPAVQLRAVGWTRRVQRLGMCTVLILCTACLAIALLPIALGDLIAIPDGWLVGGLVTSGVVLLLVVPIAFVVRNGSRKSREAARKVNLGALLDALPPVRYGRVSARRSVAATFDRARPWLLAALIAVMLSTGLARDDRVRTGMMFIVFGAAVWWWFRERYAPRPPLEIGPEGLSFPQLGLRVPWMAITAVTVTGPDPADQQRLAVAFALRDVDRVLYHIPEPRRRRLRRHIDRAGGAIAVDVAAFRELPDEVIAAARGYLHDQH